MIYYMGFFGSLFKAAARGGKNLLKGAARGIKATAQKASRGVKSAVEQIKKGVEKVKAFITGKKPPAAEPKLSTTLRNRGAFKPKGKAKVPYEPPIKLRNPRPPINKGQALNDPIMTRRPSGYMGESI